MRNNVHALVDALGAGGTPDTRKDAAEALMKLLQGGDKACLDTVFATRGAVPRLVALVGDGNAMAKWCAAAALRHLAVGEEARMDAVFAAGVALPLVQMLRSGIDVLQECAAKALMEIGMGSAARAGMALDAGAVGPLVAMLCGTDLCKEHAAGALARLAFDSKRGAEEVASAVEPLVALLGGVPLRASGSAAMALNSVAALGEAWASAVADAGAVPPLVGMVTSRVGFVWQNAAWTLLTLTAGSEVRAGLAAAAAAKQKQLLVALLALIIDSDSRAEQLAETEDAEPYLATLLAGMHGGEALDKEREMAAATRAAKGLRPIGSGTTLWQAWSMRVEHERA